MSFQTTNCVRYTASQISAFKMYVPPHLQPNNMLTVKCMQLGIVTPSTALLSPCLYISKCSTNDTQCFTCTFLYPYQCNMFVFIHISMCFFLSRSLYRNKCIHKLSPVCLPNKRRCNGHVYGLLTDFHHQTQPVLCDTVDSTPLLNNFLFSLSLPPEHTHSTS